jgi:hypothetical protein
MHFRNRGIILCVIPSLFAECARTESGSSEPDACHQIYITVWNYLQSNQQRQEQI